MTNQEAYEAIRAYFTRDDAVLAKSETEFGTRCWYRKDADVSSPVRCGVGCLIPDELYLPYFDMGISAGGVSATMLFSRSREYPELVDFFGEVDEYFLTDVQERHDAGDTETPEQFVAKLDALAFKYDLAVPA